MSRVIVLTGLPGSGKTTYARNRGWPSLSSDALRILLADDENNQAIHADVFAALRYLLRRRLALGRPLTCVDATNLTPAGRRPYLRIGERFGARVEAVYFDVAPEVCKRRNRLRSRVVPDEVVDRMARRLVPPSLEEGFAKVTVAAGVSTA